MSEVQPITEALVDTIAQRLARNRAVRRRLPGDGRLHVDRLQPFLCVYRRPPDRDDAGTDRLLLSQASYLVAEGATPGLDRLIGSVAGVLAEAFGTALVFELWSAPQPTAPDAETMAAAGPECRILAPAHGAPRETLEALERAILQQHWPGGRPHISVDYADTWAPPGLASLLPGGANGAVQLGLEVSPHHRDPATGTVLPEALAMMRGSLGQALKQAFYAFAHAHATYRPAHFHELGRRAMTRAVWEADRRLAHIGDAFDLLLHVTPVNADAAWLEFRDGGYQHAPEFLYRPQRVDPAALKRDLFAIHLERIEDPTLHDLFAEKRDELDRQLTLLGDRDTTRFLPGSLQIYGGADDRLIELARAVLRAIPPDAADAAGAVLDAESFAARAEAELAYYRDQDPDLPARIEIRDDVPGLTVSRGRFLIGRHVAVSAARVDAAIQHEIGTHVVTWVNGLRQPFQQLHAGMAGYEELQEGIAVLAEYLVGQLSRPRLRQLAGRVLAVACLVDGAGFVETHRLLEREVGFPPAAAYGITMRVYRGGGLTKDVVYLRGLTALLDHLGRGHKLEDLLLGKIALAHVDLVEELRWRQILTPGPLRPRYLDEATAARRLAGVAGRGVLDLIGDASA